LRVKILRNRLKAECTRRRGLEHNLEGKNVFMLDDEKENNEKNKTVYVKRKLSKWKTAKPVCSRGLGVSRLRLHEEAGDNSTNIFDSDLIQSGNLVLLDEARQGQEIEREEYCLAEHWENSASKYLTLDDDISELFDSDKDEYVGVLYCDKCQEEVLCWYSRIFFGFGIEKNPWDVLQDNLVHVFDKNGDDEVNFEEFKSRITEYITLLFNIFDENKDGSVDKVESSFDSFSFELFEELLRHAILYFDNSGDNAISTIDYTSDGRAGPIPLSDLIGLSLINLPAPVFTAYTLLDKDQDEVFTAEEIQTFLIKLFTLIDKNSNCYISLDEVLTMLEENYLPRDYLLGVKLVLQHYLTLAQYFVTEFFTAGDTNKDDLISLEEVLHFSSFPTLESSISVGRIMGQPPPGILYLAGDNQEQDKEVVVWLTVLQNIMDSQVFRTTTTTTQCSRGQTTN